MLLERLTVCDLGTFRGEQVLDLRPRTRNNQHRPVVLFGGLNGAGKTTLLNCIRHVLYGRQSLDASVTQRAYEEHLRELIHNPAGQLVKSDRAHVTLHFTYARLGKKSSYKVQRSWIDRGTSVDEMLTVTQDQESAPLLIGEAAQSFLSQLIPAGVSQFFFFDGEKIAALAKDSSDEFLADAIRRLLGLDMADRLRSDLSVFLKGRRNRALNKSAKAELDATYVAIESAKANIHAAETELETVLVPELTSARQEAQRRRQVLSDRGGVWAGNRTELEWQLEILRDRRFRLEERIREELTGSAVFSLAPSLCQSLLHRLQLERQFGERHAALEMLRDQAERLKASLASALATTTLSSAAAGCVDTWVQDLVKDGQEGLEIRHQLSGPDAGRLEQLFQTHIPAGRNRLHSMAHELMRVVTEMTRLQDTLAHSPTEASIEESFLAFQEVTQRVALLDTRNRMMVENIRQQISTLIVHIRKARKLEEAAQLSGSDVRSEELAERVQAMIADFKTEAAAAKCRTLEKHFVAAFRRLARKDDLLDHAEIDPLSFAVSLIDRHGRVTPKKRLSAGEKQIFAIAMLEALAKTSGRNLPIIIDTPLGRLDSKHRSKIVEKYLPSASHQVLVLSTDTEIDQSFYEGLKPSISHAFHLEFNEQEAYTSISEGYFWTTLARGNHAA